MEEGRKEEEEGVDEGKTKGLNMHILVKMRDFLLCRRGRTSRIRSSHALKCLLKGKRRGKGEGEF